MSITTILISTSPVNNRFAVAPQIPRHTHHTFLRTTITSSTTKSSPASSVSYQNKTLSWPPVQNSINCRNKTPARRPRRPKSFLCFFLHSHGYRWSSRSPLRRVAKGSHPRLPHQSIPHHTGQRQSGDP